MTPVACKVAAPWIAAGRTDGSVSFAPVRHHIHVCLRCQAASVRHRRRVAERVDALSDLRDRLPGQPVRVLGALGGAAAVAIGLASLRRSSAV